MEDSCPVFHHWWRHLMMRMLTMHQTWQRLLNNVKIWKVVLHIVYELVRCAWNTPWPQLAVTRWQSGSPTSAAQGQIGTGRRLTQNAAFQRTKFKDMTTRSASAMGWVFATKPKGQWVPALSLWLCVFCIPLLQPLSSKLKRLIYLQIPSSVVTANFLFQSLKK